MVDEVQGTDKNAEGDVTEQQFLRAITSFEAIILSQIDVKNKLGDRLNYSIRSGLIILGVIAISILILLLTLSSQINRISGVVKEMNKDFISVHVQMESIDRHMDSIEKRVALLHNMSTQTEVMNQEMASISEDMSTMRRAVGGIGRNVGLVREDIGRMTLSIDRMNADVQMMGGDMHRMGQPARSMNKMFPFP